MRRVGSLAIAAASVLVSSSISTAGWAAEPKVVFGGGPVQPTAAIALARAWSTEPAEGWRPLSGRLGTIDVSRTPADIEVAIEVVRVFAGYAGWSAGQLEGEIAEGAWYVVSARPDDCFVADPDRLWRHVLRRQGGRLALVSTFPADPRTN